MLDEYSKPPCKCETEIPVGYTVCDINALTEVGLENQYKANNKGNRKNKKD